MGGSRRSRNFCLGRRVLLKTVYSFFLLECTSSAPLIFSRTSQAALQLQFAFNYRILCSISLKRSKICYQRFPVLVVGVDYSFACWFFCTQQILQHTKQWQIFFYWLWIRTLFLECKSIIASITFKCRNVPPNALWRTPPLPFYETRAVQCNCTLFTRILFAFPRNLHRGLFISRVGDQTPPPRQTVHNKSRWIFETHKSFLEWDFCATPLLN